MLDDFFIRAILISIGISVIAGPLGCFVIWQRLSYFGDTMSHSSLLGIAFALFFQINTTIMIFISTLFIALFLYFLQKFEKLSSDSLLGILAHSSLAIGLVLINFMPWIRVDLLSYLFGDILSSSKMDVYIVWVSAILFLTSLIFIWKPLLILTLSEDLAKAENMNPTLTRFIFMIILALIISIAMKLVGILLITSLLIIPAATARQFCCTPETMAISAALIGISGSIFGLSGSYYFDLGAGTFIIVSLFSIFVFSRILNIFLQKKQLKEKY